MSVTNNAAPAGLSVVWIVRYDEIFLKSDSVRRKWENTLKSHILKALPGCRITIERGRIWLYGPVDPEKLKKIFGIVSFSECQVSSLEELEPAVLTYCSGKITGEVRTFAVRVRRIGTHQFRSADVAKKIGKEIITNFPGLRVDLTNPDRELFIEIRDDRVYLYDTVIQGAGGVPSGVAGSVVALVSGGIDSPVAIWMMMKRGCHIIPVYIDLGPFLGDNAIIRVKKVIDILREYQSDLELRIVTDNYVVRSRGVLKKTGNERYVCLLCKRRMYRIAEEISRKTGAKGVVTGESLGQVASQTLDNLFVLDKITTLPLYRPLIGFDKSEIITIARKIGTFQSSILPVSNCCCAVPNKPATCADPDTIDMLEMSLDKD